MTPNILRLVFNISRLSRKANVVFKLFSLAVHIEQMTISGPSSARQSRPDSLISNDEFASEEVYVQIIGYNNQGTVYYKQGDFEKAAAYYGKVSFSVLLYFKINQIFTIASSGFFFFFYHGLVVFVSRY
jgi:hypothetical protein